MLFAIIFHLSALLSIAADSILIDESIHYSKISFISYYEDKTGNLDYTAIQNPEMQNLFKKSEKEIPSFGFSGSAYWFMIQYHSNGELGDYLIEVSNPVLDRVDLYYKDKNGGLQTKSSGRNVLFTNRDLDNRNIIFILKDIAPEGRFFFRVQSEGSLLVPISISSLHTFYKKEEVSLSAQMIFLGIMAAMVLYNFLLGISLKDKTYFIYIFYLLSITLVQTNLNGLNYQYLWSHSPYWEKFSTPLFLAMANIGMVWFNYSFLKLKVHYKILARIIFLLIAFSVLIPFTSLIISYSFAIKFTVIIGLCTTAISLLTGILISLKRYRPAIIYLIAWIVYLVGSILFSLGKSGVIPVSLLTENTVQIGTALESILISFALADRIKLLQREKEQTQVKLIASMKESAKMKDRYLDETSKMSAELAALNASLEKKVEDRTKELNSVLHEVNDLKLQQDADYFLNTLLITPLTEMKADSRNVKIESLVKQKKTFIFKNETFEIGGDINISDTLLLDGNTFIVFLNGDAMGKSLQGASGVLVLGTVFKAIINRNKLNKDKTNSPETWIRNAFIEMHTIFSSFDGYMLMSVVFGLIDESTGDLYYINAEHPEMILYRDGNISYIENHGKYTKLGSQINRGNIAVSHFQLQPGDSLFCGSDGKDDILITDPITHIKSLNHEVDFFQTILIESKGNLNSIYKMISENGRFTDDFSLLKITYNPYNI